jgi:hypothetical protein
MTTTTNSPGRGAMTDVEGISKSFGETKALAGEGFRVARNLVRAANGSSWRHAINRTPTRWRPD